MQLELAQGYGILLGYFVVCVAGVLTLRRVVPLPSEVSRKILHIVFLGSVFIWIYAFETWWVSAIAAIIFAITIFPALALAERIPGYSELLTERKRGEIKNSLVMAVSMYVVLICVCCGWLGEKYLLIAAVSAWGLGDAAAALVGKRFGRHYIEGRLVEGRKSLEGTLAMFVVSFVSVLVVLIIYGTVEWHGYIPIAAVTAAVCAVVELYTRGGMDTVTCPFAAVAILIPLIRLWGG
ncbi:MAG: diacylglycerol/polyprenol kinase family protein [Mahellales bacterium]|jgi:phytol kinase